MDEPTAHVAPAVHIVAAQDYDAGWNSQVAQGAMKTHRLLSLVRNFRLYDEKVEIAYADMPTPKRVGQTE